MIITRYPGHYHTTISVHYSHGAESSLLCLGTGVGGVDARRGLDPLTPTRGTHGHWTQPPNLKTKHTQL